MDVFPLKYAEKQFFIAITFDLIECGLINVHGDSMFVYLDGFVLLFPTHKATSTLSQIFIEVMNYVNVIEQTMASSR